MKKNRKQKKSTGAKSSYSATTCKVEMSNVCLTSNNNSTNKCGAIICDDGSMEFQSKNAQRL